ncbi:MAG: hypothetical protein JNJ54_08160 [Myxococcaceae bacterium]|nr:hypothetical protein [Myxococcaceae bacterium]
MRLLLMTLLALGVAGCGSTASCKCGDGQVCAFQGTTSRCARPCSADAGVCGSGSCTCAASCANCLDCLLVCSP